MIDLLPTELITGLFTHLEASDIRAVSIVSWNLSLEKSQ